MTTLEQLQTLLKQANQRQLAMCAREILGPRAKGKDLLPFIYSSFGKDGQLPCMNQELLQRIKEIIGGQYESLN